VACYGVTFTFIFTLLHVYEFRYSSLRAELGSEKGAKENIQNKEKVISMKI
jgi:hypothetical protein